MINNFVFTGSADHTTRCWLSNNGTCHKVYNGHTHKISCLDVDKNIRKLLCYYTISEDSIFIYKLYLLNNY